jgi:histone arginine demethylase JMJD6
MMALDIPRRANLSYDEFAATYLYPGKPVVVTDALKDWKAVGRWTPEFFKGQFGDMTFTIHDTLRSQIGYKDAGGATEYTMASFVDRVMASTAESPAPYFRNRVLAEYFPTLVRDIEPLPIYFAPNWLGEKFLVKSVGKHLNRGAAIEIYIGGTGGAFPVLHYDGSATHAFLMQIYGRKEYIVYPPDQREFLYPSPDSRNLSMVNSLDTPDLERFPLFARAQGARFELRPGELLFVPALWWHTAKMLTPSITVSINTVNDSNWGALVDDLSGGRRNPLVAMGGRAYLSSAGAWRAWRDRRYRPSVVQGQPSS